tara:strand:+ start:539 stop:1210 length:672 start_codon:yes stop_codon:yes gene_type:complete
MTVVAAGIGAAVSIGGGILASGAAKREARRRERQARKLEAKLNQLEANRQEIINPFEGIQDLSSMLSNPFANLGVATQAAEMEIEQTDIALANTLDTLRTTGGGSGSATALAQAAMQSKKQVAASIEQQEKANNDRMIQGEAQLQQQKMSEQQRLQQADVSGKQFVFGQQEAREMQQLDRLSNQIGALRGQAAMARADSTAAITGAIGSGLSTLAGGIAANKG